MLTCNFRKNGGAGRLRCDPSKLDLDEGSHEILNPCPSVSFREFTLQVKRI